MRFDFARHSLQWIWTNFQRKFVVKSKILCRNIYVSTNHNHYKDMGGDGMPNSESVEHLYIVISQTGTILSRILKLITKAKYNHASIALSEDLTTMYSFGRKYPYNPFLAGFVTESASYGTFKRFYNTEALVLSLEIPCEKHREIKDLINRMVLNKKDYRYNYLGLYLAAFKVAFKKTDSYYCSEFVKEILKRFEIEGAAKLPKIIQPIHFLNMPYVNEIYSGKLKDYSAFYSEKVKTTV